ncbi:MAG: T9SS type A sorting domain-containing protein, partial [Bacteroidetes bacterium]|nr:T9SS type A sorting domain-containing protein [Bacteroidota bacterium]
TVGIQDVQKGNFSVYPNPNKGLFTVKVENPQNGMIINIMDATGKIIRTLEAEGASTSIDLSDAAAGVYFVQMTNGNQASVQRVTISR